MFVRHALAPGMGDPDNFHIGNTQHNLDDTGRAQARAIGTKLAAANIKFSAIYSSYWSRCLKPPSSLVWVLSTLDGLFFFQNHAPRDARAGKGATEAMACRHRHLPDYGHTCCNNPRHHRLVCRIGRCGDLRFKNRHLRELALSYYDKTCYHSLICARGPSLQFV